MLSSKSVTWQACETGNGAADAVRLFIDSDQMKRCNGSGVYRWGGAVVNGKFTGKSGPCHSCQGTGQQTARDIARNVTYNRHKLATLASV